ncbi:GntR family transcriptional regulator [Bradyrhizobium sp. U87765 SZCCT0131]|uniref:GntR family transcriptional regulator n=1 Tax=unclassified Bradyrhizobium TaxID=2631580 RepID=UPI001BA4E020|nr:MULTISPECIES: GntR family transcriptional regulator [unclassified Bradyrhizobium]MBR1222377.1 GntR family transcriptional regulator [Bradyrhizobium sp. U87765 SZCCT0131]MBR1264139.1 GntR family transcriptional regulator [Bradyrhizobium sp. U87765 SZCCT0134]MBR1308078.1 GntR family transcriptional regulator [Bradyrhizobium sp. U87765 SZCCT0110]MBR1320389.1 GntR family transcriptional regulator [Bradyrhizobium sp. U87765 SZCCT0109]MBR1348498.1 GntR family transcriptional regulator [Bradyrhizo
MAATPKSSKAASAPKNTAAPRKAAAKKPKSEGGRGEEGKSLVQQAYESIKERIINLHFLPGQYLNEAAICAQLKLGRTPVHQALQRLHLEGLVDVLPRKGIIVQPDSLAEIMKILDSRVTVEPELARAAARRVAAGEVTADQLSRMMEIATATVDQDPPDIAAFTANDRWFHREIAQLSDNAIMSDFARVLHERSTRFWYLNLWQTIDVPATNHQHAEIAAAIIAGDDDLAAQRMLDHISALRSRLEKLQRMSPNAFRSLPPR